MGRRKDQRKTGGGDGSSFEGKDLSRVGNDSSGEKDGSGFTQSWTLLQYISVYTTV